VWNQISGENGSVNLSNAAVTLSTAANYTGSTRLEAGSMLTAGLTDALTTSTSLILGASSDDSTVTNSFDMNGYNQTLASITNSGIGYNQILNSATGSAVTLSLTGESTYGGHINGNLNLTTATNVTLTDDNAFTGTTTITGGQFALTGSGKLLSTSSVTVNAGATLLLGVGYGVTDVVNNAADLTLAGGTLAMGGTGGAATRTASQTFATLTLTANSVIDFSSLDGNSSIYFGSIALGGNNLSIWNYTLGTTSLYDANATGLDLTKISFYSGEGSGLLGTASLSGNQLVPNLVPIPEPGVILAACLLLGWLLVANRGMILARIRRSLA
jgi:fibronectin-binding autotransporter adhesin